MAKLIRRWLTDERLRTEFSGRYTGTIADVTMEVIHNKFCGAKVSEPVIRFDDGIVIVPNQRMRQALVDLLGPETDHWRGCRIAIHRQAIEYADRQTGEVKVRFEKRAEAAEAVRPARSPFERGDAVSDDKPTTRREREPGDEDEPEPAWGRDDATAEMPTAEEIFGGRRRASH